MNRVTQVLVTTCPKCETCFKVSQSQLEAAAGAVRCGACLLVFQADEHLRPDQPAPELVEQIDQIDPGPRPQVEEAYTPDLFMASAEAGVSRESPLEGFEGTLDLPHHDPQDDGLQEMVESTPASPPRSKLFWGVLAVILIISLAMQYLWVNRLALAQNAEWRAHYLWVCQYLACDLTPFDDIDQLSTVELLVRAHPILPGALAVDLVLKNDAEYPQEFPLLRLNFSDKSGRLMAARTFDVSDYLGGELQGVRMIPANTEVRLSLAVVDPGPEAVGYSVGVLPVNTTML